MRWHEPSREAAAAVAAAAQPPRSRCAAAGSRSSWRRLQARREAGCDAVRRVRVGGGWQRTRGGRARCSAGIGCAPARLVVGPPTERLARRALRVAAAASARLEEVRARSEALK